MAEIDPDELARKTFVLTMIATAVSVAVVWIFIL